MFRFLSSPIPSFLSITFPRDSRESKFTFLLLLNSTFKLSFESAKQKFIPYQSRMWFCAFSSMKFDFLVVIIVQLLFVGETKLDYLEGKVQEIWDYQINPDYIQHKLVELQDGSRRNNLQIDGIEEEEGETWEISETKATKVFKEKLGIDKYIMIERAHRTKRNYKDKDKKRPRTIVLRLENFKEKSIILKNVNKLKGSDVYINEDFSRETTDEVKQLRSEGKFAYLNYRTIITRDQGKK